MVEVSSIGKTEEERDIMLVKVFFSQQYIGQSQEIIRYTRTNNILKSYVLANFFPFLCGKRETMAESIKVFTCFISQRFALFADCSFKISKDFSASSYLKVSKLQTATLLFMTLNIDLENKIVQKETTFFSGVGIALPHLPFINTLSLAASLLLLLVFLFSV